MKSISTEILIKATPDKIWRVFTNFENYPRWNPFIISISGDQWVGGKLNVEMRQQNGKTITLRPTVSEYVDLSRLVWKGRILLPGIFDAKHCFSIHDNGDGTSTFKQWEYFWGILRPFLGQKFLDSTKQSFEEMNLALKSVCES